MFLVLSSIFLVMNKESSCIVLKYFTLGIELEIPDSIFQGKWFKTNDIFVQFSPEQRNIKWT